MKTLRLTDIKQTAVLLAAVLMLALALTASSAGPGSFAAAPGPAADEDVTYTVRQGDTLSHIAASFNTSVSALLAANPDITNPNLIYPGQQILVTEAETDEDSRLVVIAPTNGPAGSSVQLRAEGFDSNTDIEVGIGPENSEYVILFDTVTNNQGEVFTNLMIPDYAEVNEDWVVVIRLEDDPSVREISNSFRVTDGDGIAEFEEGVVYLIAVEDENASGAFIGCIDTVVPTEVAIDPDGNPLRQSLEKLLALDYRYRSPDGLYNAIYASDLELEQLNVEGGEAEIHLSGDLNIAGTCDTPRIAAQIAETAAQFGWVEEVQLFINGEEFSIPGDTLSYIIQPGDTLSEIAVSFGIEPEDILEENPQILNPALIVSGNALAIPADEAQIDQPVLVVGPSNGEPGTSVLLEGTGLFPEQEYILGIGRQNSEFDTVDTVFSDDTGRISIEVAIPDYAEPGERWVIILSPVDENRVEVSNLFLVTE